MVKNQLDSSKSKKQLQIQLLPKTYNSGDSDSWFHNPACKHKYQEMSRKWISGSSIVSTDLQLLVVKMGKVMMALYKIMTWMKFTSLESPSCKSCVDDWISQELLFESFRSETDVLCLNLILLLSFVKHVVCFMLNLTYSQVSALTLEMPI